MNKCEGLTEWNKMKTLPWTYEMETIASVDRSRWSRCCNINSTVSTCWNMAAASLQATALQHINRLNVAMYLVFLQWLTLSPCFCRYDTWIPILLCHKDIFYGVHLLLDYTLCHHSEVVHISLFFWRWDLISCQHTPRLWTMFGSCHKLTENENPKYFQYFKCMFILRF